MKGQAICATHGGKAPQALAKAQAAMERAEMRLRGLTTVAVDVLERLLRADSEAVVLGAAKDVLDLGGHFDAVGGSCLRIGYANR